MAYYNVSYKLIRELIESGVKRGLRKTDVWEQTKKYPGKFKQRDVFKDYDLFKDQMGKQGRAKYLGKNTAPSRRSIFYSDSVQKGVYRYEVKTELYNFDTGQYEEYWYNVSSQNRITRGEAERSAYYGIKRNMKRYIGAKKGVSVHSLQLQNVYGQQGLL